MSKLDSKVNLLFFFSLERNRYLWFLRLSSRARASKRVRRFDASPSVSCVTPWAVQTRYDGIAWYVSGRICAWRTAQVPKSGSEDRRLWRTKPTFPP